MKNVLDARLEISKNKGNQSLVSSLFSLEPRGSETKCFVGFRWSTLE